MAACHSISDMLAIQGNATFIEVAAIVTVVEHIRNQQVAAVAATGKQQTWDRNRWQFAGRLERITGRSYRIPSNGPSDEWTMTGRIDPRI